MKISDFQNTIWQYYRKHKRSFPWRKTRNPYHILVSEIMLQQTQAPRVVAKYTSFLKKFPTTQSLATARLSDVLREWQGLGYNRRALYLKQCAEKIERDFGGKFPRDHKTLLSLPGIGPATAGDLLAFAWNIPVVVIETNIRSVFIHFFFKNKDSVSDADILPLIQKTLDEQNPRDWYSALFDYGAHLKESGNPNKKSKHYTKQSPLKGSNREKRSQMLKLILQQPQTEKELEKILGYGVSKNLETMQKEGLIKKVRGKFIIL
ncbi:MAG: A/G-specific adenine glycosylase [bacterium]